MLLDESEVKPCRVAADACAKHRKRCPGDDAPLHEGASARDGTTTVDWFLRLLRY